jgi:hypothetical protein
MIGGRRKSGNAALCISRGYSIFSIAEIEGIAAKRLFLKKSQSGNKPLKSAFARIRQNT